MKLFKNEISLSILRLARTATAAIRRDRWGHQPRRSAVAGEDANRCDPPWPVSPPATFFTI
jgi:hypothetical protein